MVKRSLMNVFIIILCFTMIGCRKSEIPKKTVDKLNEDIKMESLVQDGLIFSITNGQKGKCVPVRLSVYENGKYTVYTAYKTAQSGVVQNMMLQYSKSTDGIYTYDVLKIIQASMNADNVSLSMDNLAEYEIYAGNGQMYVVENGTMNKYLEEFLEQIDINLNTCAEKDYY